MLKVFLKYLARLGLFGHIILSAQDIPITPPMLVPFPQLNFGASYYSLKPTQNLVVKSLSGGWQAEDEMAILASTIELDLLRYHWGSFFLKNPGMDIYSTLSYSFFNQLGSEDLPPSYPSRFLLNESAVSGFSFNIQTKALMLNHSFTYRLGKRQLALAHFGTGWAHLSLLKNEGGLRVIESNGLGIYMGLGWKFRILGRPGKRLYAGVDLGYSMRFFTIDGKQEGLTLPNGSANDVSAFESMSLNTADIRVTLDVGEFLYSAYTPFRDPVRLGLLNMGIGYGFASYLAGEGIQYDSTGISLPIGFNGRLSRNMDFQLIKYNWPFHFIRQSNIDLFSGLGVRFWKSSVRTTLPTSWASTLTDGSAVFEGMRFSPRVTDIYLNHEILFPLSEKFHFRVNGGTGFASMTLYENELLERLIDANSMTWQIGAQTGYTLRGDGSSKVSLGAGFHYYHQAFSLDMEASNLSAVTPGELIPIKFVDLSNLVFTLEIGLVFGGNPNGAFKAANLFREKKFKRALEVQDELIQMYPDHHNKDALRIQRQMIEDSLVTYYYQDVRTILNKGRLETALSLIERGSPPPGQAGVDAVQIMRLEIAEEALSRARLALQSLDHEEAERNILIALKSDPRVLDISKVLLSRSYIIRATILYQAGVYNRSLYWLKQADGMSDRYGIVTKNLRQKIGDGRLEDANEGILKEDRHMVLESMQDAKTLNPSLGEYVDDHMVDLLAAIKHAEEQTIGPMKRMALDNLLDDIDGLSPENFRPKIGMKGALIARYVGQPERRFMEDNYELWVYPKGEWQEIWLYLKDGLIENIEYKNLD